MLAKLEKLVVTEPTWLTEEVQGVEIAVCNFFEGLDKASHDIDHVYRVVKLAMLIGNSEKNLSCEEAQIICLTALLHDVCDHKFSNSCVRKNRLESMLEDTTEQIKTRVIDAVEKVSWTYETSNPNTHPLALELICVRDSDRLDAMGSIGIARCFCYSGEIESSLDCAREHFDEKLLKIKDHLITNYAKEIGNRRHKIMIDFCAEYDEETSYMSYMS